MMGLPMGTVTNEGLQCGYVSFAVVVAVVAVAVIAVTAVAAVVAVAAAVAVIAVELLQQGFFLAEPVFCTC